MNVKTDSISEKYCYSEKQLNEKAQSTPLKHSIGCVAGYFYKIIIYQCDREDKANGF